ncbi:MAG TPA: zf-HC2 domain-containing protein [Candidatus Acidoferrales bacterium]|nr:zf-HC2 domain-containing protein [Candidatus Acidoferrales bacterium]
METDTERKEPACRKYEAMLEDYLGGDLDAASAKTVAEHVEECAGCRHALNDASASVRLLHAAAPVLVSAPSPGFARQVMARIRMDAERRAAEGVAFWQPFVSMAWKVAATAMVVLMILLTYATRGNNSAQQQVASVSQAGLTDVFSPDPTRAPANQDEVLIMVADSNHGNN